MSIAPIAPIGPAALALRIQAIGAAETELMAAVDAAQGPPTAPTAAGPAARPAIPADPVRQAVDAARADAAGRQAGLGPLLANLSQALTWPDLPGAVRAAIGQVLAFQLPSSGPPAPETIRQAVAQSGLFLEAHLAQAPPGAGPPPDLKAALLTLLQALPPGPAGDAPPQPQRTAPPVRGAALTAQAPVPSALPADADVAAILQHLRPEAERAVARQTLHQLASLPDGTASAWMFELPIATPQGAAVAQFEVDRDATETDAADAEASWRVRFSVDIEPLGPVHIHLGMTGHRAAVTVWAEREGTVEFLRSQGDELARALPGDVVFRLGAPREPIPARGKF
ncbi:MAG TPA: flagellar hook-length control protein FliK, partial [Phenylobacterium sp.]|nr:flagellar hook-length control protein FliK [Phenylobacterium sp.]